MPNRDLTFDRVTVRTVNLPLGRPVVARIGAFDRWAMTCVDVRTAGGLVGRGYISPYLIDQARAVEASIEALAAGFIGQEIAPVAMYDAGFKRISLMGQAGIALYALAGLDIAFWDAHAQAAEVPLAQHLGGRVGPVRAYNSCGLWLGPVDRLAAEAAALREQGGFDAVKLRLGRATDAEDLAAIREARRGAGDDAWVMSDFNQGLGYVDAKRRLAALDDAGVHWFEEPIPYHDFDNYARLTAATTTPVMLGENFHGPRDLHAALAAEACDLVMPDLMRIGGVTGWLRAAAVAAQYDIELSSHLFPEVSAHLMQVTPTAGWLEWTDWAHPILEEPFAVKDGHVIVPDRPGNGMVWNEAALERYAA